MRLLPGIRICGFTASIKDNEASSVKQHIVLTRPGGSITLNGRHAEAKYEAFPHLQSGASYLIFLKFVPASGGYESYGRNATLIADGDHWNVARKGLAGVHVPELSFPTWLSACAD